MRGQSTADLIPNASLSVFCSIAFLCRVSRRLALFRGTPECVRQHLRPAPFLCVEANRHRHLFADLFAVRCSLFAVRCLLVSSLCPIAGCSVLIRYLLTYIYIYFRLLRLPVSASIRVLCVEGPCPCVSLVLRKPFSLFLHPRLLFGSRPPRSRLVSTRACVLPRQRVLESSDSCIPQYRSAPDYWVPYIHVECRIPGKI